MSQLRVKIELNKGRHGIPVKKLAKVAEEAGKFFHLFARDMRLGTGEWVADNFKNGSLGFDVNYIGAATDSAIINSQKALNHIADSKTTPDDLAFNVSKETFLQFARITTPIDVDDSIHIGVYKNDKEEVRNYELTRQRSIAIERAIMQTVEQYGGVQGVVTVLYKESNLFHVRELSTGDRISCEFPRSMYKKVLKILEAQEGVVNVEGWMTVTNGKIERLMVSAINEAAEYQDGDIERFFGCDPAFTGNQKTNEYLDDLRGENTEDYLKNLSE